MKKAIILFIIITITVFNCFCSNTEAEKDSIINVEMHGDIIQSCIIDALTKAVNSYTADIKPLEEIYIKDNDLLLSDKSIEELNHLLKRKVIRLNLSRVKDNPPHIQKLLRKSWLVAWGILFNLSENKIRVKIIPWATDLKENVFTYWYTGRYEYDCNKNQWVFVTFEEGWI